MDKIDKIYTKYPFYGQRRIRIILGRDGIEIGRKKIRTLMHIMGITAIYPKPNTSRANSEHQKYPYLLRKLKIIKPNQVWATDITYIKVQQGWLYLVAIIDWYSRFIISWQTSITLEAEFCFYALEQSLQHFKHPEIFNSDQGTQFTSNDFTGLLKQTRSQHKIKISMDGIGRCFDNIIIERFWRNIKYEDVYIKDYANVADANHQIATYINFYNNERPHQSLHDKTPKEVYHSKKIDPCLAYHCK